MSIIYTIGHSNYQLEYFLKLLNVFKINIIVDVRGIPYSKYASQYNKESIQRYLQKNNIQYIFMGEELGARSKDPSLYSLGGKLNFEQLSKTKLFNIGIDRIKNGINKGYNIAIMCTEKEPIDCHRSILVARKLHDQGIEIYHILENGNHKTHKQLEQELLDFYFTERMQISLFEENNYMNLIEKAYLCKNKEIGYTYQKV